MTITGDFVEQRFPILGGDFHTRRIASVPYALVAEREKTAQRNHHQTVETLASRGGLAPKELLAVLLDTSWRSDDYDWIREIDDAAALREIDAIVTARGGSLVFER